MSLLLLLSLSVNAQDCIGFEENHRISHKKFIPLEYDTLYIIVVEKPISPVAVVIEEYSISRVMYEYIREGMIWDYCFFKRAFPDNFKMIPIQYLW